MDEIRALPPLVRGKVAGVLYFYVHEIKVFRNILLLANDCDVVVQIQWWGEVLPSFIRPQKINIGGQNRKCNTLDTPCHCKKYEIRTKVGLFKSYLQTCEVLELGVSEIVENLCVGSAFLRDLVNVFNQNDKTITTPIINYAGDEIGEMTIHFTFSGGFLFSKEKNFNHEKIESPTNVKSISLLPNLKNITKLLESSDILFDKSDKCNNMCNRNVDETYKKQTPPSRDVGQIRTKNKHSIINKNFSINLPEVTLFSDTSRVLNFNVNSKKNKLLKVSNKTLKPKATVKKKPLTSKIQPSNHTTKSQTITTKNRITQVSQINSKPNSVPATPSNSINFMKLSPTSVSEDSLSVFKNTSSKEKIRNVMHYLLGSDMSKEDEESALNDLIKMSPSHDLVSGISQLYTETNIPTCDLNLNDIQSDQIAKVDNLNFNLSNSIERNYYKTFFMNCNKSNDFEIVELLNKPDSMLRGEDFSSKSSFSLKAQVENDLLEFPCKNLENVNNKLLEKIGGPASCPQCKYYKKLEELNSIIESLKHFEKKILNGKNKTQENNGC